MPRYASTNGTRSSANYIAELQKRATVDRTEANKYAVRRWLQSASRLYGQGDWAMSNDELDMAYVYYFRGCSIILELLPGHAHYNEVRRDPLYINLKNRANDEILGALETIGGTLEKRYGGEAAASDELDEVMQKYPPVSGVSPEPPVHESNKYSALENLSLDDLPPVPMHAPQARRPSQPVTPPSSHRSNVPLPPPPRPPVTSNMPPPSTPPVKDNEQKSRITFPVPQTLPTPSSLQQNNSPKPLVVLPPRTNNAFPSTPSIDPATLMRWITKKENQPSILLLDVRPRAMHDYGCIRHRWICQIEPLVLRRDVTSMKIQESLVMNPEVEQFLFAERDKFDLVVYYDQDSQKVENANEPLKNLHAAIYELEFRKYLPRMPMLLAGGFDAWESVAKEKGIYRAKQNAGPISGKKDESGKKTKEGHRPPLVWLKDLVGKGPGAARNDYEPVTVHHTVYDYFNHKRDDGALQSMSRTSQTPPLQGIFNHTLSPPLDTSYPTANLSMPSPQKLTGSVESTAAESDASSTFKYPDIKPNTSSTSTRPPAASGSAIQRRNTFIDNPFHGFTGTQSQLYDKPPIPAKPTRLLPPPPPPPAVPPHGVVAPQRPASAGPVETAAPPLPFKPSSLTVSHQSVVDSRYTPVSDSSVSQMGGFTIGTMGLKNLGNTCFMSSIIQCLSGTIPLARYLISGTFKHDINKTNPLGTGGVLAESFAALLRAMWTESCSFLSPATFREALVRFAPQFSGSEQQDSQEFLMFLMDGLHEDVNRVVKRPPPDPEDPEEEERFEKLPDWHASAIAWEKYLARNASIIVSLFQGQYRSRLTCLTCGKTSTTYNVFMSLSLPIPAKGNTPPSVTLYQCFDRFFKEEVLENDDAWNCPRCKVPRRSKKQLTLSRLPDVLLIHLKRFSYDGPFHNKLETLVNYPVRGLDLAAYLPNSMFPPNSTDRPVLKYDLYGVSNHYGSLTGGHYTACVHNGYRGEWHYFDDTRVSVCDESKVVSRAGYNLFYVRQTVK